MDEHELTETDVIGLLRGRERALNASLKKVQDALIAFGVEPQRDQDQAPPRADDETTVSDKPIVSNEIDFGTSDAAPTSGRSLGQYGRPVRAIVQDILESENRAWTSAEVQDAVAAEVGPERVDEKLKATVRTALWTLGKNGRSVKDDAGRHTAVRWLTDTETPGATGVSGTAPTSGLGGEDDQTQAQDHRHDPSRRDGVHLDRTPVGG